MSQKNFITFCGNINIDNTLQRSFRWVGRVSIDAKFVKNRNFY